MAEIIPFRALRYNPRFVSDLTQVVAPPYDVISPEAQDRYYARHPYNVVRLILAKDETDLRRDRRDLKQDRRDLRQRLLGALAHRRSGLQGLVGLQQLARAHLDTSLEIVARAPQPPGRSAALGSGSRGGCRAGT